MMKDKPLPNCLAALRCPILLHRTHNSFRCLQPARDILIIDYLTLASLRAVLSYCVFAITQNSRARLLALRPSVRWIILIPHSLIRDLLCKLYPNLQLPFLPLSLHHHPQRNLDTPVSTVLTPSYLYPYNFFFSVLREPLHSLARLPETLLNVPTCFSHSTHHTNGIATC